MSKFWEKVITVSFAVFLALGWNWTDILKDYQLINEPQRFHLLIGLTLLLTAQQIYLVLPSPIKAKVIEQRKVIIESQLITLLEKYYDILDEKNPGRQVYPTVRVNVMLPTKKWRGLLGSHLKIYYYSCPDMVIYSSEEFSFRWSYGEGTCGSAWKLNKPAVFDTKTPALNLPAKNIHKNKLSAIKSIKCTLSIPISQDGSVVGILNLDSKQNIKDTQFLDNEVLVLAHACAEAISGQFHEDGVEG